MLLAGADAGAAGLTVERDGTARLAVAAVWDVPFAVAAIHPTAGSGIASVEVTFLPTEAGAARDALERELPTPDVIARSAPSADVESIDYGWRLSTATLVLTVQTFGAEPVSSGLRIFPPGTHLPLVDGTSL